jgi:type IV pilus assembly protein PilQ
MIPQTLTKQLTVKVSKEHNGLVVTGPRTDMVSLEEFVRKIDIPLAQVLFECIVVDYTTTDRAEFGITANNFGGDSGLPGQSYFPVIDISDTGSSLNRKIGSLERHLGISNLGTLSSDFFIRLNMLEQEGKANVRSHPQIASLNGYPAKIEIGTTQYYLLESKTTYVNQPSGDPIQTAQRFETVEADMSLEVVPYVNPGGELMVELKAQFNTPAGTFDPDIPPTINRRTLTSTVCMKNGQTIVLGGLVQDSKTVTADKLPILGSIPILGRLFQNRSSSDTKSELMIYMTPHVYYGSEGTIDIDSVLHQK